MVKYRMDEIRKAGDYLITQSMRICGKEIVLGENLKATDGKFYLVANYEKNEIFERYSDALISDDYLEVANIFTDRVKEAISSMERSTKDMDTSIVNPEHCIPLRNEKIDGKIIVIKPESLNPEYRRAGFQICYCNGGNGTRANGLGITVFCKDYITNRMEKFNRSDVLGILKEEHYPNWLKDKLKEEQQQQKKKKPKEVER